MEQNLVVVAGDIHRPVGEPVLAVKEYHAVERRRRVRLREQLAQGPAQERHQLGRSHGAGTRAEGAHDHPRHPRHLTPRAGLVGAP